MALFLDEFGYLRWPEPAPTWQLGWAVAPRASRAGNNTQWRTMGGLNALSGQVDYLDNYVVGRQQVIRFYPHMAQAYPDAECVYVIQDNWNIHTHPDVPDVLDALEAYPRLEGVELPTYAPMPPGSTRLRNCGAGCAKTCSRCIAGSKTGRTFGSGFEISWISSQFAHGSQQLLHYVGLLGEGTLAHVIRQA